MDHVVQMLGNESLALKKQIAQGMFFISHEDVLIKPLPNVACSSIVENQQKLVSSPQKLAIEAPSGEEATNHLVFKANDLAILFQEKEVA